MEKVASGGCGKATQFHGHFQIEVATDSRHRPARSLLIAGHIPTKRRRYAHVADGNRVVALIRAVVVYAFLIVLCASPEAADRASSVDTGGSDLSNAVQNSMNGGDNSITGG